MSLRAEYKPYTLIFKETAITSRNSMDVKTTYLLRLWDDVNPEVCGIGECNLFEGLSAEDTPDYQQLLAFACNTPDALPPISSIRFGFETARLSLRAGGSDRLFDTSFTSGVNPITINGLVWMGDKHTMMQRMRQKLNSGFRCIKIKIGGIDFADELSMLAALRSEFSPDDVQLRLDANGAFNPANALERLKRLSDFHIHSIEQPIQPGQVEAMASLCELSPISIALDEELIGFRSDNDKAKLLDSIKPQYIILKPALCGGFAEADAWIRIASERNIGWWATSALESNIGLNAIAQWVSQYNPDIPQGLGTGALYTNNFPTSLFLEGDKMWFKG